MQNPNDDLLKNLATEIAQLEAQAREIAARAEQLKAAESMIRTARGTGAGDGAPPLATTPLPTPAAPLPVHATPPAIGATRPRARHVSGDLTGQIEDVLTRKSMRPLELAATIGTTPELTQDALDGLQRDGRVYRFHDGAYTWRIHNPSSDVLNALIKRYMTERQVSRAELRRAIPHDDEVGKMAGKRIDNHLDIVRSKEAVWAQEDESGSMVYWLVPGQMPPKEMDGRKVKRVRTKDTLPVKKRTRK